MEIKKLNIKFPGYNQNLFHSVLVQSAPDPTNGKFHGFMYGVIL